MREAIPFGLKTMESLLQTLPRHRGLLLSLCRGFTQYGAAFIQADADEVESVDYMKASAIRERAFRLFLRARGYGLRGLELDHKGISQRLSLVPDSAVRGIQRKELPMLFWTAAAWGSAINLGKDRAEMLADLGTVRALMERGLALDEGFEGGAFHEAFVILEALPPERAARRSAPASTSRARWSSPRAEASPYGPCPERFGRRKTARSSASCSTGPGGGSGPDPNGAGRSCSSSGPAPCSSTRWICSSIGRQPTKDTDDLPEIEHRSVEHPGAAGGVGGVASTPAESQAPTVISSPPWVRTARCGTRR